MRCFCVEIEPASLQGLKGELSNKIGSRNRHQYISHNYINHNLMLYINMIS